MSSVLVSLFVYMCYWQSVNLKNINVLSHRACLWAIVAYDGLVANLLMDVILKFFSEFIKTELFSISYSIKEMCDS